MDLVRINNVEVFLDLLFECDDVGGGCDKVYNVVSALLIFHRLGLVLMD